MNKDLLKLLKRLEGQGFTYRFSAGGRLIVYRHGLQVASISLNQRDSQGMINSITRLAKAGFKK